MELTGLTSETTYYFRVTSADASANIASDPVSPGTYSFFTPIASMNCFTDQTVTDFELGTTTDTYISIVDDGELILKPAATAEFTVLPPTSEWDSFQWVSGNGSSIVSGGSLIADGTRFNTEPLP